MSKTQTNTPPARRLFTAQTLSRVESVQRDEGSAPAIKGDGAVFYREGVEGTEYKLWDDLVERIMPGAFDRALREGDCRGLFNHDPNQVLGRQSAGTLRLSIDATGLRYEIDPADTTPGRDTAAHVKRRDVTGSSFSFVPRETTYREVDGVMYIERHDLDLWDTGPVTFPAYESTTAEVRATLSEADRAAVATFRAKRADADQPSTDTAEPTGEDRNAGDADASDPDPAAAARQRERDQVNARALEMIAKASR